MLPYSDETKRLLNAAQWEAERQGLPEVASQHLLLGLFHINDSDVTRLLDEYQVEPKRERLIAAPNEADIWPPPIDLPGLTVRLDRVAASVMGRSEREAQRQKSPDIMPEHILLGLLYEERGLGSLLLRMHGLTPAKALTAFSEKRL